MSAVEVNLKTRPRSKGAKKTGWPSAYDTTTTALLILFRRTVLRALLGPTYRGADRLCD
ncbi:MAG: hypothetical protein ACI85K_003001 [Hyphomicrobiaceae bacterium]|jgi:hypothetical protein